MRSFCGFFHPTLTSETFYMIQVLGLAFVSNLNDFFSTRQTVKRVLLYYFPSGVQVAGEGRGAWDGSPLPWPCQKTNGACEKTGDTCLRRVSSSASKITCIENLDCGYYMIWYDIFLLGNRINSYRVLPFSFGLGMWKQLGHTKGRTFRTLVAYHVREELSGYFSTWVILACTMKLLQSSTHSNYEWLHAISPFW